MVARSQCRYPGLQIHGSWLGVLGGGGWRSEERIVRLLFRDRSQRSMARTQERFRRQRENLLADLLPGQLPRLVAPANGARKHRVTHDGHMRSVVGPSADDIGRSVLRVARGIAVSYAQAAQVNEIIRAIALVHRRVLQAGMQAGFGVQPS